MLGLVVFLTVLFAEERFECSVVSGFYTNSCEAGRNSLPIISVFCQLKRTPKRMSGADRFFQMRGHRTVACSVFSPGNGERFSCGRRRYPAAARG